MRPLAIIDLETTGISTKTDKIVQVAITKINSDSFELISEFSTLVNPGIPIPADATTVHGITDKDVEPFAKFAVIAQAVANELEGCDIAGYNSNRFDVPLLMRELSEAGVSMDLSETVFLDVFNLHKSQNPQNLDNVYKNYYGELPKKSHDALEDTRTTYHVLTAILQDFQLVNKSTKELALISNYGKRNVDIDGKFYEDEEGVKYSIGSKTKDTLVKNDIGFLVWMLNSDFSDHTKKIAQKLLDEYTAIEVGNTDTDAASI